MTGRLSWNLEEGSLFINKKGFLLSDACVAVLIVSLCAMIAGTVITSNAHTKDILQRKMQEMEETMENAMERTEICRDTETDSS